MKTWSKVLLVAGILGMICGYVSCDHYYSVPLPPEAQGWNSDGYIGPIGYAQFGICLAAGGLISCIVSCYLYAKHRGKAQNPQP